MLSFQIVRHGPLFFIPLIVIAGTVVVLLLIWLARNKGLIGEGIKLPQSTRLNRRSIALLGEEFELSAKEQAFLYDVCKEQGIDNPEFYFKNEEATDTLFKKLYHQLIADGAEQEELEVKKALLFSMRQRIEKKRRDSRILSSTKSIAEGQMLTLVLKTGEQYQISVDQNTAEGLLCTVPRDKLQNEVRFPSLTKVTFFLYSKLGTSYQFDGRIIRYDVTTSRTMMLIGHTDNIIVMRKRNYLRKTFKHPCTFSGVDVKPQTNGSNVSFSYQPLAKTYEGTLNDISAGGCSIQTQSPLGEKRYISIEFQTTDNSADIVVGTIVKLDQLDANSGYIMHIQFVKMTRKTRNKIFSFIFEYE
ncbi:MAG: PilZ domain-containing protein [Spirochaetaceae bacterium]|jgi:hypothetical protein|nr:PilZ domain-containing protein [Spirochaetaceae bacterium]